MLHKTSKIIENELAANIFRTYVADKNSAVLDIGSGNGFFLEQLRAGGYGKLFGLDIQDYGLPGTIIGNISYERTNFNDGQFDAVTAWEVFEHLENPYFALKEISRILKPGGLFLFSMPNAFHWSNKIHFLLTGNFLRWNSYNDHRAIFTHETIRKAYAPYFDFVDIKHIYPEFWQAKFQGPLRRLNSLFRKHLNRYFPQNQAFGHFVVYILKKR